MMPGFGTRGRPPPISPSVTYHIASGVFKRGLTEIRDHRVEVLADVALEVVTRVGTGRLRLPSRRARPGP